MRKKIYAAFCAAIALSFLVDMPVLAAEKAKLHFMIENNRPVKVFIKNFTNDSGKNMVSTNDIKKALETSLINRRSAKFITVSDAASSDIEIGGAIKSYQYLERGPAKFYPGVGAVLLDIMATATQNYVDMSVVFTVEDTKTGKMLWNAEIYDYKKDKMTPQESIPIICNKVGRKFVAKCFGK